MNEGKPRPDGGGGALSPPDAPRVLFTDLLSAPEGAYVTLYGVRLFGEIGETPEVTLGGMPAEVVIMRDGTAEGDDTARDLDVLVMRIGAGAPAGPTEIVARAGGVATEPVPFTVRPGTLRFVDALGGSDASPDCSEAAPCASLGKLVGVLAPGDVAYVRKGDYPGSFPCGSAGSTVGCSLALNELKSPGTTDKPIAVVGFPGERPRLGLLGEPMNGNDHFAFDVSDAGHVVLANLEITDVGAGGVVEAVDELRIVGCRFESYVNAGLHVATAVNKVTVYGSTFAEGGLPSYEGISTCYGDTTVTADVGWNEFYKVLIPLAIDAQTALDVRFHDNHLYRPVAALKLPWCEAGAGPSPGSLFFFDNEVEDADFAMMLPQKSPGAEIFFFNNTFHGLNNCAFSRYDPAGGALPSGEEIYVRNNVIVPLGAPYQCFDKEGTFTPAADVGLVGSHNLFWLGAGSFTAALGIEADPQLVAPPEDLTPAAGSPAIDSGTDALGGSIEALPPFIRFDYSGLPRMLGAAPDIGAHERIPD